MAYTFWTNPQCTPTAGPGVTTNNKTTLEVIKILKIFPNKNNSVFPLVYQYG